MENKSFQFKKMFWAYVFGFTPFLLLCGILALFNVKAITFNGTPRYGIEGLVIAILFIPFFGLIFSVINWLILNLGNILYNKFVGLINKRSTNL